MKFAENRPVKIVMLGAGGTGGHIRYYQCTWNPRFKGVDDYLLDWTKRKTA